MELSTGQASAAMLEENLSAWLFSNFHHKDPISDKILAIPPSATNSRPWLYLLRQDESAEKLVHIIEDNILDHLPGRKRIYKSRQQFLSHLKEMAAGLEKVACHYSPELPAISHLDHGTAEMLERCGFSLAPASTLIHRLLGGLDQTEIESHLRAADHLYDIVAEVWKRLRKEMRSGAPIWETTVQGWIMGMFEELELITDSPPIVALGENSANPHYSPGDGAAERGAALSAGAVLLFDLWAKEKAPGSVYADISWVGILDTRVPKKEETVFGTVVKARDLAVTFIAQSLAAGQSLSGEQVDREVRAFLEDSGYGEAVKTRTGHGIDQEVHGFGANLDSIEFPDSRLLLEGSCFSVEPGIYLDDFGMRSEINVYISGGKPIVSGKKLQFELLRF
jgi:Xaa-Pro dipeptidase